MNAFPSFNYITQEGRENPQGMTLRDYFAAKAMQSYMADMGIPWTDSNFEKAADAAYRLADKMMEARNVAQ
jgi:hypothetical protein